MSARTVERRVAETHAKVDLHLLDLWRQRTLAWNKAGRLQRRYEELRDEIIHGVQDEGARISLGRKRVALEHENARLLDEALAIERNIAEAPFVGALGVVIKMALGFSANSVDPNKDPDSGFESDDHDQLALRQVYRHFVKDAAFDPCVEWSQDRGSSG